jgi:hypothetical protein
MNIQTAITAERPIAPVGSQSPCRGKKRPKETCNAHATKGKSGTAKSQTICDSGVIN